MNHVPPVMLDPGVGHTVLNPAEAIRMVTETLRADPLSSPLYLVHSQARGKVVEREVVFRLGGSTVGFETYTPGNWLKTVALSGSPPETRFASQGETVASLWLSLRGADRSLLLGRDAPYPTPEVLGLILQELDELGHALVDPSSLPRTRPLVQSLRRLHEEHRGRLRLHHWLDVPSALEGALERLGRERSTRNVFVDGFQFYRPIERALLAGLAATGALIGVVPPAWEARSSLEASASPLRSLLPCGNTEDEAVCVARFLRQQADREGIPARSMQVAFPYVTDNIDLMAEVLEQYGLPVSRARDEPLSHRRPVGALLSLVALPLEGFRSVALLDFLHAAAPPGGAPPAAVTGGSVTEEVERSLREHGLDRATPQSLDGVSWTAGGKARPAWVGALIAWMRGLPSEGETRSPEDWGRWLRATAESSIADDDRESLSALLEEVLAGLRLMASESCGPMPLEEFAALLRAIAELSEGSSGPSPGGVFLGGLRDALDTPSDILVVSGLNDENLPRVREPDPFFTEGERRRIGLRTNAQEILDQEMRFHAAQGAARRHLLLTHPQREGTRPLVRSRFLEELPDLPSPTLPTAPPLTLSEWSLALAGNLHARLRSPGHPAGAPLPVPRSGAVAAQVLWGMRASWERQAHPGANPWDGQAGPHFALPSGSTLTVSSLERLVQCPFRYALVHRFPILPREEFEEEDPAGMGLWVHKFLESFYRRASALHAGPSPGAAFPSGGLIPGDLTDDDTTRLFVEALAEADARVPRGDWLPGGARGRALLASYLGPSGDGQEGVLREVIDTERRYVRAHLRILGSELPFSSARTSATEDWSPRPVTLSSGEDSSPSRMSWNVPAACRCSGSENSFRSSA